MNSLEKIKDGQLSWRTGANPGAPHGPETQRQTFIARISFIVTLTYETTYS